MLQLTLLPQELKQLEAYRQDLITSVAESAFAITSIATEELLALKLMQGRLQLLTELISNSKPINSL
jgi:hypothetical protein